MGCHESLAKMSGSARARQKARKLAQRKEKQRWEAVINAGSFKNGGMYDGGIEEVDSKPSIKRCGQCAFDRVPINKKKAGENGPFRRCKVQSCVDEFCWHHLRKHKHLRVKTSSLPGLAKDAGRGLFTEKEISVPRNKKDAWKIKYDGFYVRKDISRTPAYKSDYLAAVWGKNYDLDGKMSNASAARYINACKPAQSAAGLCRNNMTLYRDGQGRPYVRAIHRVPAGGELFMAYGREYWDHRKEKGKKAKKQNGSLNYEVDPRISRDKREVDD